MTTNPHEPIHIETKEHFSGSWPTFGLMKREYFAALILQGFVANSDGVNRVYKGCRKAIPEHESAAVEAMNQLAFSAVSQADALVKALNGVKP